MPRARRERDVTFRMIDGHLEMVVTFPQKPEGNYIHRCSREVYREVAFTIEERAAGGCTLYELAQDLDQPYTQVNVALAFMKERGCVETRGRRTFPASEWLYEDAMIEWMYLPLAGQQAQ